MTQRLWTAGIMVLMAGMLLCGCDNNRTAEQTTEESVVQSQNVETIETVEQVSQESVEETESDIQEIAQETACPLEDGTYSVLFDTDSSMFHVNEAMEGKGTLTVQDGAMKLHITLISKSILNLYEGLAENAPEDEENWLQPTLDPVTYADGYTEEVYGFDVTVPYLEEEFDLALIGKKGIWYDHKVSVKDPMPITEEGMQQSNVESESSEDSNDTRNSVAVTLIGGSGKTSLLSPAQLIEEDGRTYVILVWSSTKYDYMIVDDVKYMNEAAEGENSTFTIPVNSITEDLSVIGDTTAMSTPHEIEYTVHFGDM